MNKVRIVYATMTNHSKKLAEAIARSLHAKAENIKENPVLKDVALLFIVGGLYSGESMPELLEFLRRVDGAQIKRAALVTSSATKKHEQKSVRALLEAKGIEVVGETTCPGSFLLMSFGHPNKADVSEAVRFASRLAEGACEPV